MGGVSMEWKECQIQDVCRLINGRAYSNDEMLEHGKYKIVRVGNLSGGNSTWFYSDLELPEDKYCHNGDLLFAWACTFGPHIWKEDNTIFHYHIWKIVEDKDVVDRRFFYYYLKYATGGFLGALNGSVMVHITKSSMEKMNIRIPKNLEDQHRIASILSSLDRKIELNNKINADLEEMAQAIFKNWFVDFEPFKDGKFVDSELGMIPEGWKVGRLTDVIKLMPGGTPKTSEPLYWDNGTIPFFSPKDVSGVYCFETEKHITEAGLNKCSSNLYPKDTIFITCRGTVGKVCLTACDMAMNQSNYAIKAIDGYSQYYVYYLVKSVVERLIKKSNGAVFSAITSKDFDEEILIPSQKTVEDFTNVIDSFFRRIFTLGTENSRLSTLRDTLLPRLMSGEIEVPE
mgnify:CR=1 FL=1